MLGLKPQITLQFVPTSVTGWIQIADITTVKPREALGLLPGFRKAPLLTWVLSGAPDPHLSPTACPPLSNPPRASLGKYNLLYKYNRICVSYEDR